LLAEHLLVLTHCDGLGSILDCTATLAWTEFVVSDQRGLHTIRPERSVELSGETQQLGKGVEFIDGISGETVPGGRIGLSK
jgi:hypothetical protein